MLPGAALLGATSQVKRDVTRLPLSSAQPGHARHMGDARGNHGRISTTKSTYLSTYLHVSNQLNRFLRLELGNLRISNYKA